MRNKRPKPRSATTLLELLIVIAIMSILVGLLLSAVMKVRSAADRMSCGSNMKQLGLALHEYHDLHGTFPSGAISATDQRTPNLSWLAQLLPFVEQDSLWGVTLEAYRTDKQWISNPPHIGLSTVVRLFICPSDSRCRQRVFLALHQREFAYTSYLGVSGFDRKKTDGVLFQGSAVAIGGVTDGTSNTLIAGERPPSSDLEFGWWYAGKGVDGSGTGDMILGVRERGGVFSCNDPSYDFRPGRLNDSCDYLHFWSLHSGGANFLLVDGSVRFLSYSANAILPALASRDGGEIGSVP